MCVCVRDCAVCVYTLVYVPECVCACISVFTQFCLCMHLRINVYVRRCVCTCPCACDCEQLCTHLFIRMNMCVYMHACFTAIVYKTCLQTRVRVCVRACDLYKDVSDEVEVALLSLGL